MKEIDVITLKKIQLDILKQVHDFCEKAHIRYFLCFGTLIGAARHKGYIPWDDDIDISMMRSDYERFIKEFNSLSPERYFVYSLETNKNYTYPYAKICNENSLLNEDVNHFSLGINIDLFPVDGLPSNENKAIRHINHIGFYRKLFLLKLIKPKRDYSLIKKTSLLLLQFPLCIISERYLAGKITQMAKKYDFENSDSVACTVWGYGRRERNRKELYRASVLLKFEDSEFYTMTGYDEYLRNIYGDYMQLPPEDKRASPHILTGAYLKH